MTVFLENETEYVFSFDTEEIVAKVAEEVLDSENCPYEAQVNVLITDNAGIQEYNRDYRGIDKETDVLSFPNVDYETESDFSGLEEMAADCFDPDSGELILGDIILSVDRILEQAENYGHSILREFAFLVAHSMLHLCGYDHMTPDEAGIMEEKQEAVLQKLAITRD